MKTEREIYDGGGCIEEDIPECVLLFYMALD